MRLVKQASGKTTVKMSRSEWAEMGKKAGWMKEAMPFGDNPDGSVDVMRANKDMEYFKKILDSHKVSELDAIFASAFGMFWFQDLYEALPELLKEQIRNKTAPGLDE